MKSLLISALMPDAVIKKISLDFDNVLRIKENPRLPEPVAAHPDMQVFVSGDTVILAKSVYNEHMEFFDSLNDKKLIFTDKELSDKYPGDVILNACLAGKYLFARKKSLDDRVAAFCFENDIDIINVNQGYAKCSTLVLGDKALISADTTIVSAAEKLGIDALFITSGNIGLQGYDCGFIGGASFYYNDTVYFFGDIKYHPDGAKIFDFINKHGMRAVCTCDSPLYDFGGALVI